MTAPPLMRYEAVAEATNWMLSTLAAVTIEELPIFDELKVFIFPIKMPTKRRMMSWTSDFGERRASWLASVGGFISSFSTHTQSNFVMMLRSFSCDPSKSVVSIKITCINGITCLPLTSSIAAKLSIIFSKSAMRSWCNFAEFSCSQTSSSSFTASSFDELCFGGELVDVTFKIK